MHISSKQFVNHYRHLLFLLFKPDKKLLMDTTKTPDNTADAFVVLTPKAFAFSPGLFTQDVSQKEINTRAKMNPYVSSHFRRDLFPHFHLL